MSGITPGYVAGKLGYQISPILLTGGIAQDSGPEGVIPIIALTEALNFTDGLLGGGDIGLDDFFACYLPMPGSTVVNNAIGMYPFANQAVAANAIIAEPLSISMLMICPARGPGSYLLKLPIMMALKATLEAHNNAGGLYSIITPAHIYENCIMLKMTDVSSGESKQVQWQWQLDFIKPLVSLAEAKQALGNLMNKLQNGTDPGAGDPPGFGGNAPSGGSVPGAPTQVPTEPWGGVST